MPVRTFVLVLLGASIFTFTFGQIINRITPAERIAIIISGGDPKDDILFAETERLAIEAYGLQGYRVIVMGGVTRPGLPFSSLSLIRTLAELGPTVDLRLDFLAHGDLAAYIPSDGHPALQISEERRENLDSSLAREPDAHLLWVAYDFTRSTSRTHSRRKDTPAISHIAVLEAIEAFQLKNPTARIEMHVLSCFGGALGNVFRKIPNVLVFASSPATEIARMRQKQSSLDSEMMLPNSISSYYEKVIQQKRQDAAAFPISVATDRKFWLESVGDALMQVHDYPETAFETARSPSFQNTIAWCEARSQIRGPAQVGPVGQSALVAERERTYHIMKAEHLANRQVVFDAKPSAVLLPSGELSPVLEEREIAWCREHRGNDSAACDDQFVVEFKRSERGFFLDAQCLEAWRLEAPVDELENFRRIEHLTASAAE